MALKANPNKIFSISISGHYADYHGIHQCYNVVYGQWKMYLLWKKKKTIYERSASNFFQVFCAIKHLGHFDFDVM